MRVADKPTTEPILRCHNQGKGQMMAKSRVKQKAKKKKLKIVEIAGPKSFQY